MHHQMTLRMEDVRTEPMLEKKRSRLPTMMKRTRPITERENGRPPESIPIQVSARGEPSHLYQNNVWDLPQRREGRHHHWSARGLSHETKAKLPTTRAMTGPPSAAKTMPRDFNEGTNGKAVPHTMWTAFRRKH